MIKIAGGLELPKLVQEIEVNTSKFKKEMKEAESVANKSSKEIKDSIEENISEAIEEAGEETEKSAKSISDSLTGITKAGDKMKSIGKALTVGITTPILAGMGAISKFSYEVEKDSELLAIQLDLTAEEAEKLTESAKKIYVDGFGESFEDITGAIKNVKLNLKDLNEQELEEVTKQALMLEKVFEFEVNESTRTASTLMNIFGIESSEAFDLMTYGAQNGANKNGDLLDILNEYAPMFEEMGFEADEFLGILINGAESGAWSIDKVGDAIKEFNIRAKDGSKATSEAFETLGLDADLMFEKFSKGGEDSQEALEAVTDKLFDLEDPLIQNQVGVALFGTMWEDLGAKTVEALFNTEEALEGLEDSAQKATDTLEKSLKEDFATAMRELMVALEPLGGVLVDMLEKATPMIADFADYMASLDEETVEAIVQIGLFVAAVGPVASAVGGATKGVGSLAKGIGSLSKKLGLFKGASTVASAGMSGVGTAASTVAGGMATASTASTALTTGSGGLSALGGAAAGASSVLLPLTLAVAAVGLSLVEVHKNLSEDVVPEVDLLAETAHKTTTTIVKSNGQVVESTEVTIAKFTEETKKAIGAYVELDDSATKELNELKINNEVITEEIYTSVTAKFQSMADQILLTNQNWCTESTTMLTEYFDTNIGLSNKNEADILASIETYNKDKTKEIEKYNSDIAYIMDKARKEERELAEHEQQKIAEIQAKMRETAITELTATEEEANIIRARMKEYQGRLTAEMASEMIKNANEARDGEISAAEEKYEEVIRQASRLKEAGTMTEEQYDKMVEAARKTKDKQIKEAEEGCEGIKAEIQSNTPGIENEVNIQTGKIENAYSKAWNSISGFFSDLFSKNSRAEREASNLRNSYAYTPAAPKPNWDNGGAMEWSLNPTIKNEDIDGSHFNGLEYVPFDNYVARLHKGERVLTAQENKSYNNPINLTIENFNNNSKQDIKSLIEDIEEYRKFYQV